MWAVKHLFSQGACQRLVPARCEACGFCFVRSRRGRSEVGGNPKSAPLLTLPFSSTPTSLLAGPLFLTQLQHYGARLAAVPVAGHHGELFGGWRRGGGRACVLIAAPAWAPMHRGRGREPSLCFRPVSKGRPPRRLARLIDSHTPPSCYRAAWPPSALALGQVSW